MLERAKQIGRFWDAGRERHEQLGTVELGVVVLSSVGILADSKKGGRRLRGTDSISSLPSFLPLSVPPSFFLSGDGYGRRGMRGFGVGGHHLPGAHPGRYDGGKGLRGQGKLMCSCAHPSSARHRCVERCGGPWCSIALLAAAATKGAAAIGRQPLKAAGASEEAEPTRLSHKKVERGG